MSIVLDAPAWTRFSSAKPSCERISRTKRRPQWPTWGRLIVRMPDRVLVKICGLTRRGDVRDATRLGADYVGVVLSEGFDRTVDEREAASLLEGVDAIKVAVLVDEPPDRAAGLARLVEADVIQLHGDEEPGDLSALRSLGRWKLWKVVRPRTEEELERAVEEYGEVVDGILVEGWREGMVGGSGAEVGLDPRSVRTLVPAHLVFVLAGGLTPSTVSQSIESFDPDVVDVSSGVERIRGQKDPELVGRFIESARDASNAT